MKTQETVVSSFCSALILVTRAVLMWDKPGCMYLKPLEAVSLMVAFKILCSAN